MKRKIIINRGDEYRFKIEKRYEKDDFFYEVYRKAENVTNEIFETMQQSRKDLSQGKTQFYGIGNNIIVFCGTRGEGKTSALQSFAYQLGHTASEEYVVLDTIDPSELDSEESIVRVFLSRLFSCFHSLSDELKKSDRDYDERKMNLERQDILGKFNKCYNNLMYMGQKEKQDIYQDNLDYLSELGDSRNLRTNLFLLAERVLNFKAHYCSGDLKSEQHLVILIDDADLSMGNIFKTCEDIRNYFMIPNAVVLMAADFEQLRSAIYQKYLKHFKTILKYDKALKYKNKCYSMATKFMEKMFPNGHRIELPNINHEIQKNADSIQLEYKEKCGDGRLGQAEGKESYVDLFAEDEWKNCDDMQEQLIKSLYARTGIILEKRYDIQTFLPHTLRELTHFLKLLSSMETVDFELAVLEGFGEASAESGDDMPNLLRWKKNLEELKKYYLRYWIQNYLKNEQVQLIKQMDKVSQYNKIDRMGKLVLSYIEKNEKKKNKKSEGKNDKGNDAEKSTEETVSDFAYLLNEIIRKSNVLEKELQDAIYIYFSIALNLDFVQELLLHRDYSEFVNYLKVPFYIDTAENEQLACFSFHADEFKAYAAMEQRETAADGYRGLFCIHANTQDEKKGTADIWHFDAIGAVLGAILHYDLLALEPDDGTEPQGEISSLDEMERIDIIKPVDVRTSAHKAEAFISAKNIVCNLEVRFHAEKVLGEFLPEWNRRNDNTYLKAYGELYKRIDSIINDRKYLGIQSTIGRFLYKKLGEYGIFWSSSYLSNSTYKKKYLNDIEEDNDDLFAFAKSKVGFLREDSSEETSTEAFKEKVANALADVISTARKYPLLEGIAMQTGSPGEKLLLELNVQADIIQAWKEFSSEVNQKESMTADERRDLLEWLGKELISIIKLRFRRNNMR